MMMANAERKQSNRPAILLLDVVFTFPGPGLKAFLHRVPWWFVVTRLHSLSLSTFLAPLWISETSLVLHKPHYAVFGCIVSQNLHHDMSDSSKVRW